MLLELRDVAKSYDAATGPLEVLRGVGLTLDAGQALAVVGPSGSGKSTLLNLIGALDRPTRGQVLLEGRDLAPLSDEQLAQVRSEKIGFIFQAHHLLPQCTALENVLLPTLARPRRQRDPAAHDRARELLARVGLGHRLDHRPGQLSGGERQRVAVVRALINRPRLLLADEPTGALDQTAARELTALLFETARSEGLAMIVVTHASHLARDIGRTLELRDRSLFPV
jgi:ABC-type lipoprotein export system ATPase subunit